MKYRVCWRTYCEGEIHFCDDGEPVSLWGASTFADMLRRACRQGGVGIDVWLVPV